MATRLRMARWSKVDLVDRPADAHARIALWKRDGRPGVREDDGSDKSKEGNMPIDKAVLDALPDDVRKSVQELVREHEEATEKNATLEERLTALEAAATATTPSEEDEDVTKRDDLPQDVRDAIAKRDAELDAVTKRLEAAEAIAKAERDQRLTKEWNDRIAGLDALGLDVEETAKRFKDLADVSPELADDLVAKMSAANEQARAGNLFTEVGKRGGNENGAESKMESVVKSIAAEKGVDEAEAWLIASDTHKALYTEYINEQGA